MLDNLSQVHGEYNSSFEYESRCDHRNRVSIQVHGEHVRRNPINLTEDVYGIYKPVAREVKPVPGIFPEDPLLTLPPLPTCPPNFIPSATVREWCQVQF